MRALLAATLALGACVVSSAPPAPPANAPPSSTAPAPTAPAPTAPAPTAPAPTAPAPAGTGGLTADGRHFAAERVYKGECAPAGSRGGCHTLTLRPDGSYRNWLFDAAIVGTYVIEGDAVVLTPRGPAAPERLALSPDRAKLGTLVLQP